MKRWKQCCLVFVFGLISIQANHTYYVGLTDIAYNQESGRYEIAIKVFTNDLETAIEKSTGKDLHIGEKAEVPTADTLIFNYARKHFSISEPEKPILTLQPVGRETNLDITWIYLESVVAKSIPSLKVENSMMMEVFSEQSHLVHYTASESTGQAGAKIASTLLSIDKKSDILRP